MKRTGPHTPIQYVMGKTEFCGLDFMVDERVLIPRPETEMLVETVVEILEGARGRGQEAKILDLGTGSGCIAISLTKKISDCKIVASDLSGEALAVARQNAEKHGASGRIEFVKSDLFDSIKGSFDMIVSNPPYVSRTDFPGLQKDVLKEPMMAFDGGQDGLDFYRRIVRDAAGHMKDGGFIIMEMGFGQRKGIVGLFEKVKGFRVVSERKDYNEIERVIVAQWTSS